MRPPRIPVFSARARRAKLARAAATLKDADFLHVRAAEEALDRLESVLRDFPLALLTGPAAPYLADRLTPAAGVGRAVLSCETEAMPGSGVAASPEALPFADAGFDAVVSLMSLHATDDLPRALSEAKRVLRPDGLFLAVFPGERTLHELRAALRAGEAAATGGLSPRVSPMVAVKDGGALLQAAGFALPVADVATVRVRYAEPLRLLADLRAMGETNAACAAPRGAMRRDVLAASLAAYERTRDEGKVPATFDLLALTGWSPHESQPKPLEPGSGRTPLADAVRRGHRFGVSSEGTMKLRASGLPGL